MRSTTGGENTVLAATMRQVTLRVKVANGSGTMIDLSSWVEKVTIDQDIDHPVSGCTIEFTRSGGATLSLAPLRTDSTLNRLDDGTTYSPQLDANRSVTVEAATTAIGVAPVAGDYKLLFKGFTDRTNAEHTPVSTVCRDLGGQLVDREIEAERVYGTGPGRAMELVMQDILDDTFGAGVVPLYVPASPSFLITTYNQQKQSVMDALQALAQLIGWDVRYRWDDGTSAFRLTLTNPPRSKVTPDYTFGPSAYLDVITLNLDRTNIRNAILVSYKDSSTGTRITVTATDSTSIAKYGRRAFIIQEADTSPIDTGSEAASLSAAALADLKDPKSEHEIEAHFFWPADLWDLHRHSPNAVHYNANQDYALVSLVHELSPGHHRSRFKTRGNPAGGYLTWLGRVGIAGGPQSWNGPRALISSTPATTNIGRTTVNYAGSGGTAPLSYQRRVDIKGVSTGTYSASAALGTGVSEVFLPQMHQDTVIYLVVTDAIGFQSDEVTFTIRARIDNNDGTASGQVTEEDHRGGNGGIPVPAQRIHAAPVYDSSGSYPLIDTAQRRVGPTLQANDGEAGLESQRAATRKGAQAVGHAAAGMTTEEIHRAGIGGTPVPSGWIHGVPVYDSTGSTPLIDTSSRRFQTALAGPTGIAGDIIERGGNKGDQTIDSGYIVLPAGVDFVRSYSNKHLGNLPDDASSDRRASTLNQKTGGDRGFGAIDSGNVVVAAGLDLARAYTGKHLGNMPDDATSDRRAATAQQKTGGDRGFTGLDSSSKLQTGVTSVATAADGNAGIESQRTATQKSARSAGAGASGITDEERQRTGNGGYAVPFAGFHAIPVYDSSGSVPLIDPVTKQSYVGMWAGVGGVQLVDPAGARLMFDMGATDGTSGNKGIPKGLKSGTVKNQQAITFSPAYNTPPVVRFHGGLSDQLSAKWGSYAAAIASSGDSNGTTARPTTGGIKQVCSADSLSASGFTATLILVGTGASTNNTANFASPTTLTTVGSSSGAGDPTSIANDFTYKATYQIVFSSGASPINGTGVIALMMSIDNGAYVEVASISYHYVLGVSDSLTWSGEVLMATSSTLDAVNDHFQIKVKSATGSPTISLTIAAGALAWSTGGGATYASMTPNGAADAVPYTAVAAS